MLDHVRPNLASTCSSLTCVASRMQVYKHWHVDCNMTNGSAASTDEGVYVYNHMIYDTRDHYVRNVMWSETIWCM